MRKTLNPMDSLVGTTSEWGELVDLSLSELLLKRHSLRTASLRYYANVLVNYLQGKLDRLERNLQDLAELAGSEQLPKDFANALKEIVQIRIEIRKNSRSYYKWIQIERKFRFACREDRFRGEFFFLLAFAYGYCDENELALENYAKSIPEFERIGAKKKSLKSLQNHIATDACINTDSDFIVEYHHVLQLAEQQNIPETAGLAAMNIAHAYHGKGAIELAFEYINRALRFLEKQHGLAHFYMALTYRCDILIDLERPREAKLDLDRIANAPFAEVQSVLPILTKKIQSSDIGNISNLRISKNPDFDFTWWDRLQNGKIRRKEDIPNLTSSEQRLIELLLEKPKTKFDLMTELYGDRIEMGVRENRVKNLLSRVRKKLPEFIQLQNSHYMLSSPARNSNPGLKL